MTTREFPQNINIILNKLPDSFKQDFSEFVCYLASNGSNSDSAIMSPIARRINYAFEDEEGPQLYKLISAIERKVLLKYYKLVWKEAYPE